MDPERLEDLQRRRRRLELDLEDVDREIGRERDSCAHKRGHWPGGEPAWWCEKCGGEIKG